MHEFFTRFPRAALLFGLIIAVIFGFLGITSALTSAKLPASPRSLTMAQVAALPVADAGRQEWVTITDAVFDCSSLRPLDQTQVLLTDVSRTTLIVATYSGKISCSKTKEIGATGFLSRMNAARFQRFLELKQFDLFGYGSVENYFDLCGFCGRSNSEGLVALSAVLAVSALVLYPYYRVQHRKEYPYGTKRQAAPTHSTLPRYLDGGLTMDDA